LAGGFEERVLSALLIPQPTGLKVGGCSILLRVAIAPFARQTSARLIEEAVAVIVEAIAAQLEVPLGFGVFVYRNHLVDTGFIKRTFATFNAVLQPGGAGCSVDV